MEFPYPVLTADIGGTNARFALVTEPGASPSQAIHRPTHRFPNLESAIEDALPELPGKPRSIIACAAGPVEGRRVVMTNANWTIDGSNVAKALGLDQGLLLNDFEAQALSLPIIRDEWVKTIGQPIPRPQGSQLILGPGTGLGVAALLEIDGKHFALATEAGHVDFGPIDSEESTIWPHLPTTARGRISAEFLLSGPGLVRLHHGRLAAKGLTASRTLDEIHLVEQGRADPDGEEADTIRHLWRLAARFAGDMALIFLATGGVTFSGGVLPRVISFADPTEFRARFENKAPFGELLHKIDTRLIVTDDTVLHGMSAIATRPHEYAIDYARRAWC